MDLGDICDADFDERRIHHRRQMCYDDMSALDIEMADKYAQKAATAEMLNEIHVMLRELLKRSNP